MSWSQERINQLVNLWMSGKSASVVAKEMGNVSRNAVIGKVHRLGIANRATDKKETSKGTSLTPKNSSVPKNTSRVKSVKDISKYLRPAPDYIKIKPIRKAHAPRGYSKCNILPHNPNANNKKKVTLLELRDKSCRWPSGDPKMKDFSFCGCPTQENMPYCDYHAKVAYSNITKKDTKEQYIVANTKKINQKENQDNQSNDISIDMVTFQDNNNDDMQYI